MTALLLVLAIFAAASGSKWWLEAHQVFEAVDPNSGEHARTALGHEIHSHLGRVVRVTFVLALWTLIDRAWLPWLDIGDVATGEDGWHESPAHVRAAIIAGWFLALASFFLAFSLGI